MTKIVKRVLTVILVLLISLFFIGVWIFHEAFGPKRRTVTIDLTDEKTLVCKETYNADLAAVFYDVDFKLIDNKHGEFDLGSASFSTEYWNKQIKLHSIGNWYLLPVHEGSYFKLLSTNYDTRKSNDTTLSPQTLGYDSLWKLTTTEIPAWVYSGSSRLDSIIQDKLFVSYEYRFGLYEPFMFFVQTIEYKFDTSSGQLKSKKIYDAKEK